MILLFKITAGGGGGGWETGEGRNGAGGKLCTSWCCKSNDAIVDDEHCKDFDNDMGPCCGSLLSPTLKLFFLPSAGETTGGDGLVLFSWVNSFVV